MSAEKKTSVSPITYASTDDPPILIVHGSADVIVPIQHAEKLHARMTEVKGKSELFRIDGGRHNVAGGGHPKAVARSLEFLKIHLKISD